MKIKKRRLERIIGPEEYLILNSVLRQLEMFHPEQILLFGSFATADFKPDVSDIDLCIVVETEGKRELLTDMYTVIQSKFPVDLLLYTPEEWTRCVQDSSSFAYHISTTGLTLVNRLNVMAVPGPPLIIEGEDKLEEFLSIKPSQGTIDKVRKRKELK